MLQHRQRNHSSQPKQTQEILDEENSLSIFIDHLDLDANMSSSSSTGPKVSSDVFREKIVANGSHLNQEQEKNSTENSTNKVIVTFFVRPKAPLWHSSAARQFSLWLEFDFSGLLATLGSPAPPIIPSFRSLSPNVHQATFTTSRPETFSLRHHPLISAFEESHSVEIVADPLSDSAISYRPIQLAIFDMDSTLINEEVIDELARSIGVTDAVSAITAQAMNGDIDFAESLRARLALLEGVNIKIWKELEESITIAAGARELCAELRRRGVITAVASGGFIPMAEWLKDKLGLDYAFANHVRHYFWRQILTFHILSTYLFFNRFRSKSPHPSHIRTPLFILSLSNLSPQSSFSPLPQHLHTPSLT